MKIFVRPLLVCLLLLLIVGSIRYASIGEDGAGDRYAAAEFSQPGDDSGVPGSPDSQAQAVCLGAIGCHLLLAFPAIETFDVESGSDSFASLENSNYGAVTSERLRPPIRLA